MQTRLEEFDPALEPPLPDEPCPYRGLEAFYDDRFFFGRDHLVDALIEKLGDTCLVAIIGPSGSGKSSVVFGGLLPRLKAGALTGSEQRRHLMMVPGSDPLYNLESSGAMQDIASGVTVLVVDQFEELFTLCKDESARVAFEDQLLKLVSAGNVVVLTMRSEYEHNVASLPRLYEWYLRGAVEVRPLDINELRDAIEKPAERVGLKFDERIVDDLISMSLGRAGLPLLQFTLQRLWERREGRRITRRRFEEVGSPVEALESAADRLYDGLPREEKDVAREIFQKLVKPPGKLGQEFTRQRVLHSELFRTLRAPHRVDDVLQKLVRARLVKMSGVADDAQVEVAHEALLRNWPRLTEWLEERKPSEARLLLAETAQRWKGGMLDDSVLLRGRTLAVAESYDDRNEVEEEFVRASRAREDAGLAQEMERQRNLAAANARAEVEARSSRRLRVLAVGMGVLGALALVLALFAFSTADRANRKESEALKNAESANAAKELAVRAQVREEEQRLRAENNARSAAALSLSANARATLDDQLDTALLLSLEAYTRTLMMDQDSPLRVDALETIMRTTSRAKDAATHLHGHTATVTSLVFSNDGAMLVSVDVDNRLKLWDVRTSSRITSSLDLRRRHDDTVRALALSADDRLLVTGDDDGRMVVWAGVLGERSGRPISTVSELQIESSIARLALTNEATPTLAALGANGRVSVWPKLDQPQISYTLPTTDVTSIAIAPDGKYLALGLNRVISDQLVVWNLATRQPLTRTLQSGQLVVAVSFIKTNDNTNETNESLVAIDQIGAWQQLTPPTYTVTSRSQASGLASTTFTDTIISRDGAYLARDIVTFIQMVSPQITSTGVRRSKSFLASNGEGVARVLAFNPDSSLLAASRGDGVIGTVEGSIQRCSSARIRTRAIAGQADQ